MELVNTKRFVVIDHAWWSADASYRAEKFKEMAGLMRKGERVNLRIACNHTPPCSQGLRIVAGIERDVKTYLNLVGLELRNLDVRAS